MADLSEFHRLSQPKKPPCKMAQALRSEVLHDKERQLLRDALDADPNEITAGGIMHWLAARGLDISSTAVANHRRGRCHCE